MKTYDATNYKKKFRYRSVQDYMEEIVWILLLIVMVLLVDFYLPMDLSVALSADLLLCAIRFIRPCFAKVDDKHAAIMCMYCCITASSWLTCISNRVLSVPRLEVVPQVLIIFIAALLKTAFTHYIGQRELKAHEIDMVYALFWMHFAISMAGAYTCQFNADKTSFKYNQSILKNKIETSQKILSDQILSSRDQMKMSMIDLKQELLEAFRTFLVH